MAGDRHVNSQYLSSSRSRREVTRTQVDPKVEPPGDGRPRESAADSRSARVRDDLHGGKHGHEPRPLTQGDHVADQGKGADGDAGRAAAQDGAAEDEQSRRGRRGAEDGADLEHQHGCHVEPFRVVVQDQPREEGLARGYAEEVGAVVPADVVDGAEVGGDGWDRRACVVGEDGKSQS
jgi:hypothetical protein